MTPPPRSSKIWWSGRLDRQYDGMVLWWRVFRGQGFAYMWFEEEERGTAR
jgi:hypothetical protein